MEYFEEKVGERELKEENCDIEDNFLLYLLEESKICLWNCNEFNWNICRNNNKRKNEILNKYIK